ncbi:hypothetical protein ACGF3G_50885 [Streptomyces sp. NPDC048179]|uniref:hypothetical protein n=1 Tax=Streptomyces sp. NPDC048179 TaxID=3365506 RepID=UPI003721EFE9
MRPSPPWLLVAKLWLTVWRHSAADGSQSALLADLAEEPVVNCSTAGATLWAENVLHPDASLASQGQTQLLNGNAGDDTLHGDAGNDVVLGGTGNDNGFGEDGNDVLDGQQGTNTNDGGPGFNTCRNPSRGQPGATNC